MPEKKDNKKFSREDKNEIDEHVGLRSPLIYEVIRTEGIIELRRPVNSLFWSGIAAGLALSFSVYCQAFLHHALAGSPLQTAITPIGYSVGFLIVILGRLQLFTENTITVVLPVLTDTSRHRLSKTIRLWGIVFFANMVGTLLSALVAYEGGILPAEQLRASIEISKHLLDYSAGQSLLYGIPAGFMIASIVWVMPSTRTNGFFVILIITYMIALGKLTHVVAGSTEWFLLSLDGQASWFESIFGGIVPSLVGNILGGTGLFALIAYAQVKEEI